MRRFILFIGALLLAFACRHPFNQRNSDRVSDTTHVIIEGISMYDTIVPPKLIIDSVKVYQELKGMLGFSSRLKWNNADRFADCYLTVGEDGKIRHGEYRISKDIEVDMRKVMEYVLMNLKEWEPAFLKENPSKKIPFSVEVVFYFYRDKIQFNVEGAQSYYFLRKSYEP